MEGRPDGRFWGKLATDDLGRVIAWHPLHAHSADVAAVFEAILEKSIWRRRLAHLAGVPDLDLTLRSRLCVLVALHDLGKFNLGFQAKARPGSRPPAGHVGPAMALFSEGAGARAASLLRAAGVPALARWARTEETVCEMLAASICHHGRPVQFDRDPFVPELWAASSDLDPLSGLGDLGGRIRNWFPSAFSDVSCLLPTAPSFQHAFSGLVTLADWLGSDTRYFPYAPRHADDRIEEARARADVALRRTGIDVGAALASLRSEPVSFTRIHPMPARPLQLAVLGLAHPPRGSIGILEAETGSGKTEAALARYLGLAHAGLVEGLYFALPTRTSATQMHARVHEAVERMFADSATRPPVVLAVPGELRVDDVQGRLLPGFQTQWPDDDAERYRDRGWAVENPKRYLAATIAVGTIDQVLLGVLQTNHAHLRSSSLLRHLLVIDEVHASDAYMNAVLQVLLRNHVATGGHAFLMSATLASAARRDLESAVSVSPCAADPPDRLSYPVVSLATPDSRPTRTSIVHAGYVRDVRIELVPVLEDPMAVAVIGLGAALAGARVAIVRNTVADCIATQAALEVEANVQAARSLLFGCNSVVAPHHSRYAKEDRALLDACLVASFSPTGGERPCVVVATQTIQMSLDIDVDLLVTDLCPVDVLLQRIGRLHRRADRRRCEPFRDPKVIVLVPPERDLSGRIRSSGEPRGRGGIGSVYRDLRMIETTRTELEIRGSLSIPSVNRDLVEACLAPERLHEVAVQGGDAWLAHERWVLGTTSAVRRLAELALVDHTLSFVDPENAFPASERKISSRLGASDRLLRFDRPVTSPFGLRIDGIRVPAFLIGAADTVPDPVSVVGTGEDLLIGTAVPPLSYSRWGLRRRPSSGGPDGKDEATADE